MLKSSFLLRSDSGLPDLDLTLFQKAVGTEFCVAKDGNNIIVKVPANGLDGFSAHDRIDRELDRLYFLTHVRLWAEQVGNRVASSLEASYEIHDSLPKGIRPIAWSRALMLQLKLWRLASSQTDQIFRVLLLYQVLELGQEKPDTEYRCLRNIVVHSGKAGSDETKEYCSRYGLSEDMGDRNNAKLLAHIADKLPMLEREARRTIMRSME